MQRDVDENFDLRETPLGKIIGQVHRSYILVETPTGMQLYDQHALAERINFEKLKKHSGKTHSQKLLIPEMLQLTP